MATDNFEKLKELKEMLDHGLIERADFDRLRQGILDGAYGASDSGDGAGALPRRKGTTLGLTEGMLLGPEDRRYRLENLLGEGGMGEVWKAEDLADSETLGRPAWKAIKVLREELARDPNHRKWIKQEAILASRLRHQNILHVVEWREDPKTSRPFIVMEYLSGKNLNAVLAEEGSPGLSLDRVLELMVPVADALGYAWDKHQMVHRDLKPENVFLTDKGEVKLLDFGIAAQAKKSSAVLGLEGREGAGTVGYRAPEGAVRQKDPSPRLDVYSLGVMIYELLEGRAPFEGTRERDHEPDKPDALNDAQWSALRHAFAYEPGKRFGSGPETVVALKKAQGLRKAELRRDREAAQRNTEDRSQLQDAITELATTVGSFAPRCSDLNGHTKTVASVVFSPDSRLLASGGIDCSVLLWDLASRSIVRRFETPFEVTHARFSSDGRILSSSGHSNGVLIWNVESGNQIGHLEVNEARGGPHALSPDGRLIATVGGKETTVELWDLETYRKIDVVGEHSRAIRSIAFSPNGRWLASAGEDNEIRVWDVESRSAMARLVGHTQMVNSTSFYPLGDLLVSGSDDGTIVAWDIRQGRKVFAAKGHKAWVLGVACSHDGTVLASAGSDATVRLWDAVGGQELRVLSGHEYGKDGVRTVDFSPDGKAIASGGSDCIKLWAWDAPVGSQ